MKSSYILLLYIYIIYSLSACKQTNTSPLPIIGHLDIENGDTTYHKIPPSRFTSQDKVEIDNYSLANNLYISDFFFMSCPSICPKVKKQMLRIYDRYENQDIVKLVSHTIDPKRDTPDRLKQYANNLNVDSNKWLFLTGDQDEILDIADAYFVTAMEDDNAPGGFDHSGKILLVDTKGHIRAFADGTDPKSVDDFFDDIDRLLYEYGL